jgi:hypothetical protein
MAEDATPPGHCPKNGGQLTNRTREADFMGMFKVRVTVSNPADAARSFEEDFWVDTGALYSFVPEDRLYAIGIEPIRSRDLVLADGRHEQRLLGEARMTVADLGETLTCPVIFGPPGSLFLLGSTALENFGVDADPVARRLKPISGVIGGFVASRWALRSKEPKRALRERHPGGAVRALGSPARAGALRSSF